MCIPYFRHPAVSRGVLDAQIPAVPDAKQDGQYVSVYLKTNALMCTQVLPRRAVMVYAGSHVEIVTAVEDDRYSAYVIRYEEESGEYVYCLVSKHSVGAV